MSDTRTPDHATLLKRSLLAIDQLEAKLAAVERARSEPIAIIGIGCRFAGGAHDAESFWKLLAAGTDVMSEVPKERWDADLYFDPNPDAAGKAYTKWGYFVEGDVDQFDAQFFGISRREAQSLDPQQRLLLEVIWESIEDAGIAPASLMGSQTAVYTGISTTDYGLHLSTGGRELADAYTASGTAHSMASGRISYVLGLQGPNVAVDTACSSSLVAVHLAVQSLRSKEATLALAAGVNLMLMPDGSITLSRARMMSFDGRCKTFDAAADGYSRAEGAGALVLKRLSDAQRDGDRVLAVIRGSALSQDGRSSGVTAPSGPAQEAVMRSALANSGLAPADISYIEAHGTGTSLGDPIEIKALGEVFGAQRAGQPLMVGSVKTNLGHTEAAAGVAGMIKAVLALRNRTIPPHLHLRKPNPLIAWDRYPIVVPTQLTPWRSPEGKPRRAGVSSFGFSGTNAHVIIEEAPDSVPATTVAATGPQLLALSAEKPEALRQLAEHYQAYLASADAPALADIARSAVVGRSHFTERVAVVASTALDAAEKLSGFAQGNVVPGVAQGRTSGGTIPELAFLFTGQGAQYAGMGLQLYQTQPVFRAALEQCAQILDPLLGVPLLEVVSGARPGLDDTRFTQPALFSVEYALAQLWKAWGVEPSVVMGHSVGEYVGACLAGVFSLEDGLKLIAERGRLMGTLPPGGAMAAVFTDEARVRTAIGAASTQVTIAGTNGPQNTVISGTVEAVETVRSRMAASGVESQRLNVSHAFHSHLMDPVLDPFEAFASQVTFSSPRIGIVSNVTGKMAGDEIATAGYWRRHLRHAVRFSESVATLQSEGLRVCVEVGPHPTLLGMVQRCADTGDLALIPSLRRARDETVCMLESMGQLYVRGIPVVATGIWGAAARQRRVPLPGYPFQRERYWRDVEAQSSVAALSETRTGHPLLGGALPSAIPVFQQQIGADQPGWVADHRINDYVLFPATGFLELALAAAREVLGSDRCLVRDFRIGTPMILPESDSMTVQIAVTPSTDGSHQVQIFSRPEGADPAPWQSHATAVVVRSDAPAASLEGREKLTRRNATHVDLPAYYEKLARQGRNYGPAFRGLVELKWGTRESLASVALPESIAASASEFMLHPVLLDSCLHTIGAVLTDFESKNSKDTFLPVGLDSYRVWQPGVASARCHTILHPATPDADVLRFDLHLFDEAGEVVAEVRGLELRRFASSTLARAAVGNERDWAFEISWQSLSRSTQPLRRTGCWLVLGDANGLGRALVSRLAAEGATVRHALRGPAFSTGEFGWQLDPSDPSQVRELLAEATREGALSGVIALWPLEQAPVPVGSTVLETAHGEVIAPLLGLAQGMTDSTARLWLLTRGAQSVSGSVPDLAQAPAWGLGGVIASELAALRVVRIDLDPQARMDEADLLSQVIRPDDAEDRMALRGGSALVARLGQASVNPARGAEPVRLAIPKRGSLSNLTLERYARQSPGPGQVEIRVYASGLNFRDVLNALGMYPGDAGPLGNECAGVVTAVGPGVTDFEPGDEVVAMPEGAFVTYALAQAALTVRKPPAVSFADAATIPVTFLTALYTLRHLCGMKQGDRVLIHAATGGVGMAATQLARQAGAEIFGTAGSPAKRTLARELGVHHVADSRALSFADDVNRETRGEGVDIVLNSLAADFIPASLALLRQGGRFIEIGKTGIWDAQKVAAEYPGVTYHPFFLGELAVKHPQIVREMLSELLADVAAGKLQPLPRRSFPIEKAEEAFRFMGQGLHTGKIVLTQTRMTQPRSDASYLVTGGLGALGLACARLLAEDGAKHLILIGRRAPSAEASKTLDDLRAAGVRVQVEQGDVADFDQMRAVIERVRASMPPLRGILHAAGITDDGLLSALTLERFREVMKSKVQGGWHLHTLTESLPLDFFVTFSSSAALLGSAGQGNYVAANAFLDALCSYRQARGLPGISIQWGVWSGVGMGASVDESHHRRWAAMGVSPISPEAGMRMLSQLLQGYGGAEVAAIPITRSRLPANVGPFFSGLKPASAKPAGASAANILRRLTNMSKEEKGKELLRFLSEQIVNVLALGASFKVDPDRSLMDLGLDSLMAMELRNRLQSSLGVTVPVDELLQGRSLAQLSERVLSALPAESARAPVRASNVDREELSL